MCLGDLIAIIIVKHADYYLSLQFFACICHSESGGSFLQFYQTITSINV